MSYKNGHTASMRVLLDTNILIHREATNPTKDDIGVLFRWLDRLKYEKCVHPQSIAEVQKLQSDQTRNAFNVKLRSYHELRTQAPLRPDVEAVTAKVDIKPNDVVDTALINELAAGRVDLLLTEDKKIHWKAAQLGLSARVFKIEAFLEKVTAENPELVDYKVLSVKKEYFGNVDINAPFFDSFKGDYPGFERWFAKKADETAYICDSDSTLSAFLFLKVEDQGEPYSDISPQFPPKRRLKIGTFKVSLNGAKIGERFLKIIFDNAIRFSVEEIYVTIFARTIDQQRLIALLQEYGFSHWGTKGEEMVLVRSMTPAVDTSNPRKTFPFYALSERSFIVPIYPDYHTSLFPDSILNNESAEDFVEHEPFRNAISKVYISRSHFRDLKPGDTIVFYRTGGYHLSVVTTIGVVENVRTDLRTEAEFIQACRKRSVFTDAELSAHWNYYRSNRPFIVNFLYSYSFPKRPNLARLIDLGVIADVKSAPRGFEPLTPDQLKSLLVEAKADDHFIVDQT